MKSKLEFAEKYFEASYRGLTKEEIKKVLKEQGLEKISRNVFGLEDLEINFERVVKHEWDGDFKEIKVTAFSNNVEGPARIYLAIGKKMGYLVESKKRGFLTRANLNDKLGEYLKKC